MVKRILVLPLLILMNTVAACGQVGSTNEAGDLSTLHNYKIYVINKSQDTFHVNKNGSGFGTIHIVSTVDKSNKKTTYSKKNSTHLSNVMIEPDMNMSMSITHALDATYVNFSIGNNQKVCNLSANQQMENNPSHLKPSCKNMCASIVKPRDSDGFDFCVTLSDPDETGKCSSSSSSRCVLPHEKW
jgi:hypothetical protein